jgi:hypothetical protein
MQLKEAIGPKYIMKRQSKLIEFAFEKLRKSRNIILLGNKHLPHLPSYSMVVKNAISGCYAIFTFVFMLAVTAYKCQLVVTRKNTFS